MSQLHTQTSNLQVPVSRPSAHNVVYLDHNATTPLDPRVREAMLPWLGEYFGNPSSIHALGRRARAALDDARERLAKLLGARANEVIFTSGGTEADNLALLGVARANRHRGRHILTTCIEHHAVLHAAEHLQKREGFDVTFLPVNRNCLLEPDDVRRAIRDDTILVSVMTANNETGTIQPVTEIAEHCRERGVYFHTDAVQALGKIPVNMRELSADLLSISAHKFYGPKGVGALMVESGVRLEPLSLGGAQEMEKRAGTENVAGILGMVAAAELAVAGIAAEGPRQRELTEKLWSGLAARVTGAHRNGHPEWRVPNTLNVSFSGGIDGEALLISLDLAGIAVSSGSACIVGTMQPSHVLRAMGLSEELARASVRFSSGKDTTEEDVAYVLEALPPIVARLRR